MRLGRSRSINLAWLIGLSRNMRRTLMTLRGTKPVTGPCFRPGPKGRTGPGAWSIGGSRAVLRLAAASAAILGILLGNLAGPWRGPTRVEREARAKPGPGHLAPTASVPIGRATPAEAGSVRPNIVLIHAERLGAFHLGCYGGEFSTPHLDGIARDGVKFNRCVVGSPICTPSRYMALTGRYASRSLGTLRDYPAGGPVEVWENASIVEEGEFTLAHVLRENSYTTGLVGDWTLGGKTPEGMNLAFSEDDDVGDPSVSRRLRDNEQALKRLVRLRGFDEVESVYPPEFKCVLPESARPANIDWVTAGALGFIQRNERRPFFLCLFPPSVFGSADDYLRADPRITPAGLLDSAPIAQPPRWSAVDRSSGKKDALNAICLDDAVGVILRSLWARDLARNTLVIFTSDGAFGGSPKHRCFGVPTPLLIRWPDRIGGGTEVDDLTSHLDLVPTILEASGVRPPKSIVLDGRSLLPLLGEAKPTDWRTSVMIEELYSRTIVTSDGWEYTAIRRSNRYPKTWKREKPTWSDSPLTRVEDHLLDMNGESPCRRDLASDPRYRGKLHELREELRRHSTRLPHAFGEFKATSD